MCALLVKERMYGQEDDPYLAYVEPQRTTIESRDHSVKTRASGKTLMRTLKKRYARKGFNFSEDSFVGMKYDDPQYDRTEVTLSLWKVHPEEQLA